MISILEKKVLKYLYKEYQKTNTRELYRCTEIFEKLSIKGDLNPISNSEYIDPVLDGTHECYQINSVGIIYADNNFGFINHFLNNKKYYISGFVAIVVAIIGVTPFLMSKLKIRVSVIDVRYELQDENESIIHRKSWQDNLILEADNRNIDKMFVSIKLRNSSDFQLFSKIENYDEIFQIPFVVKEDGDFFSKKYSIPANGDSGFIFAINITPFTRIHPMSLVSSGEKQDIEFYNDKGKKIETAQINIADTYGITIPYKIGIYNNKGEFIDTVNFNVLCRARMSNLKATLDNQDDRIDLSKTLNFECLPTF
ncbi:MAG: hypothetical protein Athens071416_307 [Parcubacteria group bacterium Athens0714_16]|nr:MAG: hypothetical protein Athens071416_307 [Parcubacteria group bacterium Athens0714_16]